MPMEPNIISFEERNIEIGRRIESRRKILNISSRELGAAIGVSHQQIYKYECGRDRISIIKLKKIAEVLHTDLEYLVRDDDKRAAMIHENPGRAKILDDELTKLARHYVCINDIKMRETIRDLIRLVAKSVREK